MTLREQFAVFNSRFVITGDEERDHSVGDDALLSALKALAADHSDPEVKDATWTIIERWEKASADWWYA